MDILRAAALVLGLYFLLRLLWVASAMVFVVFLGILFGLVVARGADLLKRWRIPRGVGAVLVVVLFLGVLAGLGAVMAPALREQTAELRSALPQAVDRVEAWLSRQGGGFVGQLMPDVGAPAGPAASAAPSDGREGGQAGALADGLSGQLGAVASYLFSFLSSTVAVVTGLLLILFIALYIGVNPGLYRRGLLHLFPHQARPRAKEVLSAVGTTLQRWLVAQLVAMVVIGVVTTVVLSLMGVPAALPLGILAGLLEFVPVVGPFLSAIPAVAMGFLDSPRMALFIALAYMGIQFFENQLLVPLLMKEGVDLPPVLTLVGFAVMSVLFGFLGMLVTVPLLAAILVAVKLLYVEDVVGDEVKVPE